MLGISSSTVRSCLPLEFSFAIAVFIGGSYRSIRVSGISSGIGRSYLPFEFSFVIAVFIGGSYWSIRVLGISSGIGVLLTPRVLLCNRGIYK